MASKKTRRQLADEAYLRNEQLVLDVAHEPQQHVVQHFDRLPAECPGCQRVQKHERGWVLVFGDLLQCGGCSTTISVPREEYERYGRALHEYYARKNAQKKADHGPRIRGAR